ncbi:undecaprenyl-diphosphatase [Paenibacillus sp. SYP-B3998]|uniref:Undecaprenyl-diphosphatase n=1 Tax=Paenibacillus sp. SYP-B3998 TaxID=2678564 RepID=A0A6G3ZX95_9BACL|nr:undecaprenyl-diphosphatase [Paenibacillus sp. SYP-B3998]NEW06668.1 undecaprenyl-diphosphatase [Paenibacillus sp. SYP-B3998]
MNFEQLDYQLFQIINHLGMTVSFLNPLMRFLAQQAEYGFYLGVVVYWFTRRELNRKMVAQALISACMGLLVSGLLGHFFYRDRPFVAHSVLQLINHPANASFPSDHAIGAFVIATSIWLFRRRDGILWLALALCIAFSRIWTGVHYPSDVMAGAMIGMVTAVGIHQFFNHSKGLQKVLRSSIGVYEKIEAKFWPRTQQRFNEL